MEDGSFAEYLRTLSLKPHGSPILFYDGREKTRNVHEAVVNIDIGERDLLQCADAVMYLRGEYLYKSGLYDKIQFEFANGFVADYKSWMEGKRLYLKEIMHIGYSKQSIQMISKALEGILIWCLHMQIQ